MESIVTVKIEPRDEDEEIPEVTEDDVYVDIALEESPCMDTDDEDVKPPLEIKQERISPIHWQWNPNKDPANSASHSLPKILSPKKNYKVLNKKTGGNSAHTESDEEVDVDTPFCGTLQGQTQSRNQPVASRPIALSASRLLNFNDSGLSSQFNSTSTAQKTTAPQSQRSAVSIFNPQPQRSSVTNFNPFSYDPVEFLRKRRSGVPESMLYPLARAPETALDKQQERSVTCATGSQNANPKKSTARKPVNKSASNVAINSTTKQSQPTQKPAAIKQSERTRKPALITKEPKPTNKPVNKISSVWLESQQLNSPELFKMEVMTLTVTPTQTLAKHWPQILGILKLSSQLQALLYK